MTAIDTYVSPPVNDTIDSYNCGVMVGEIAAGHADLLDELRRLRAIRDAVDTHMRVLVAFGRQFVHPRPYTLRALADAAGISISGIRTYTTARHVEYVRDVLATDAVTIWKDTDTS